MTRANTMRIATLFILLLAMLVPAAVSLTVPEDIVASQQDTGTGININWTASDNHNYTLFVRDDSSYPSFIINSTYTSGFATYVGTIIGGNYTFILNVTDAIDSSALSGVSNTVTVNDMPNITSVRITPTVFDAFNEFTCKVNVTDRVVPGGAMSATMFIAYGSSITNYSIPSCASVAGNNFTCSRTFSLTGDPEFVHGNQVSCSAYVTDGHRTTTTAFSSGITIENSPPTPVNVQVQEINATAPTLYCNFTFTDPDNDNETVANREFKWFVNNEDLNNFLELPEQRGQSLQSGFDQDDRIKCSVRVYDDFTSQNVSVWVNSSNIYQFTENSVPQLYNISDSTSNSTPANIGDIITFSGSWFDAQDAPESARMFVCAGTLPEEAQYESGNATINLSYSVNDGNATWFYARQPGLYVSRVAITPFKFVENGFVTYAARSTPDAIDIDWGHTLTNFSDDFWYWDKNLNGHYDSQEPIINSTDNIYHSGIDAKVTSELFVPNGQILSNFSINYHKYRDIDQVSGAFNVSEDDIYYGSATNTVGSSHIRATLVTQIGTPHIRDHTLSVYDFYVYEVDNINDTTGTLIAQDNDNKFQIGVENQFVMQYNAKPFANKYLAIKVCIDEANDGTCDTQGSNPAQYVGIRAASTGNNSVMSAGSTLYDPNIEIVYGSTNTTSSGGCDEETYCSTSSFSSSSTLTCDYEAVAGNTVNNSYYIKVCDDGIPLGPEKCSIYRSGTFWVNHPPQIDTQPEILVYNQTNGNYHTITANITQNSNNLFCNYTYSDQDDQPLWAPDTNTTVTWYRKVNGASTYQACSSFSDPSCPPPNSQILSHTLTMLGDQWYCKVTPHDKFTDGTPRYSNNITIGFSDAQPGTSPVLMNTSDNSNASAVIYPGETLAITVNFKDVDDSRLRVYVCNSTPQGYGIPNNQFVRASGCMVTQLYSNITAEQGTPLLEAASHIASYAIPSSYNGTYNYTVVLCDNDQQCTNASSAAAQGSYQVEAVPIINSVTMNTTSGPIGGGSINETDNLVCNYNITLASKTYVNNLSSANITYLWQYYVAGQYFNKTGISANTNILSHTVVSQQSQWRCGVTVPQASRGTSTTYSSPAVVQQDTGDNVPPTLNSIVVNGGKQTALNIGDTTTIRITWSDPDDTQATAYICAQGDIQSSGCIERELKTTTLSTSPENVDYIAQASDNFSQGLSVRLCDDSFECSSSILNGSIIVNHPPKVYDVQLVELNVPGDGQLLRCDYSYNTTVDGFDDEDDDGATYAWYVGDTEVISGSSKLFSTGTYTGLIYCAVTAKDIYGATGTSQTYSSNAVYIEESPESALIWNSHPYTSSGTYQLYGYTERNFTNITVYVYNGTDRFTFRTFHNVTTVSTNSVGTTYPTLARASNKSLITVPLSHAYLFTSAFNQRYIDFANHDLPYFAYYDTKKNITNSQEQILQLNPVLNSSIAANEGITVYDGQYPTGWFNLTLDLYTGANMVELFIKDLNSNITSDIQTVFSQLVLDADAPTVNISPTLLSNESRILRINISDAWSINETTLLINITNQSNSSQNHTFDYADAAVSCDGNETSYDCSVPLSLGTGTWDINITIADNTPNTVTYGWALTWSDNAANITSVNITELLTGSTTVLSGKSAFINWSVDPAFISNVGVQMYNVSVIASGNGQVINLTNTTATNITLGGDFQNGTNYSARVIALSNASVWSAPGVSANITYIIPTIANVDIQDGTTGNTANLESESVYANWSASSEMSAVGIQRFFVSLREASSGSVINQTNTTAYNVTLSAPLTNGTAYDIAVRAFLNTSDYSGYRHSDNLTYLQPLIPMLTLASVDNSTVSAQISGANYLVDLTNNSNSTVVLNASINITCVATSALLDYTDAILVGTTFNNSGRTDETINVTIPTTGEGLHDRYVICADIETGYQQPSALAAHITWYTDYAAPSVNRTGATAILQSSNFTIPLTITDAGVGLLNASYAVRSAGNNTILRNGSLNLSSPSIDMDPTDYDGIFTVNVQAYDRLYNKTSATYTYVNQTGSPRIQHNVPAYFNAALNFSIYLAEFDNASYILYNGIAINVSNMTSGTGDSSDYLIWPVTIDTASYTNKTYSISMQANDTSGNQDTAEAFTTKDSAVPTFTNVSNTSGNTYYTTQNITLYATAADNHVVSSVILSHNATGTWQNISATGTYQFNATIPASVTPNGASFSWYFTAIDGGGNTNTTATKVITITNRAPIRNGSVPNLIWGKPSAGATFALSPYFQDADGDALTYSVTASDSNGSGVLDIFITPLTKNLMIAGGDTGIYNVTITVNDSNGGINSSESVISFQLKDAANCISGYTSVNFGTLCGGSETQSGDDDDDDGDTGGDTGGTSGSGTSGSSGGGGGGGGGSYRSTLLTSSSAAHVFSSVSPDVPIVFDVRTTSLPVDKLSVYITQAFSNVRLEIEKSRSLPAGMGAPAGYDVLEYITVTHDNLPDESIGKAVFDLQLNATKTTNPKSVVLLRYKLGWNPLPTTYRNSNGLFHFYQAQSPGLSVFALAVPKSSSSSNTGGSTTSPLDPTGNAVKNPTTSGSCFDGVRNQDETGIDCGGSCLPCSSGPELQEPSQTGDQTASGSGGGVLIWVLILTVVAIAIGGGAYYVVVGKNGPRLIDQQYPISPEMPPLEQYVRKQLNKGISEEKVRSALLETGWDHKKVEATFDAIHGLDSGSMEGKLQTTSIMDDQDQSGNLADAQYSDASFGGDMDPAMLNNIKDFVTSLYFQGQDPASIEMTMSQQGWDQSSLAAGRQYIATLDELKNSVNQWRAAGYTTQDIRDHLLSIGWDVYTIYEMLRE